MRHRLRHATRPDAPLGRSRGSLPSSVLTLALLAIVAALASPSSAGGPGSERAFLISHRSGSTYESRSVPFGQVRTGGLKAIVEEAMAILGGAGGGTITFERGVFDFESGHIELNHVENLAFEGQGIDATILRNHSDAAADTEVFDVSSADRVQIRDMTIHAGGSVRFTSDAIDFDGGNRVVIERVKITASRGRGIVFDGKDGVRSADHNVIRDCIVTGVSSTGIELLASSNNVIEGCTVTDVGRHGIHVTKASKVAEQAHKPSNGNIVRANTVDQAGLYGIAVTASDRNVIVGNTVTNSSDEASGYTGIRIASVDGRPCDANVIRLNVSADNQATKTQKYGLRVKSAECKRNSIDRNQLSGNWRLDFEDLGTDTVISDARPPVPSAVAATVTDDSGVRLRWSAGPDTDPVARYTIYRDGGAVATVDSAERVFGDTDVAPGRTYAYNVGAVDRFENASGLSAPVRVAIPDRPAASTDTGGTPTTDACTLEGTDADDVLIGTPGDDVICGYGGDDVLKGLGGNDRLLGGPGRDRLEAGDGNDDLRGGRGADDLRGGRGADVLKGGRGGDVLRGGQTGDKLHGGRGNDTMYGHSGADRLNGGSGNDIARGGTGTDRCTSERVLDCETIAP